MGLMPASTRLCLVFLAVTCAGCVGIVIDRTASESITHPVPLRAPLDAEEDFDRWACQPDPSGAQPRTSADFLAAWGEPKTREPSEGGETWVYAETGRWCGVWLAFVVPLPPLVLPVCETYDRVRFENGVALHVSSKRFVKTALGVAILPVAGGGMVLFSRAGNAEEARSAHNMVPGSGMPPEPCVWRAPPKTLTTQASVPE